MRSNYFFSSSPLSHRSPPLFSLFSIHSSYKKALERNRKLNRRKISINPYENMHNSLIKFLLLRSVLWNRINCYSNKLSTSTILTFYHKREISLSAYDWQLSFFFSLFVQTFSSRIFKDCMQFPLFPFLALVFHR